MDKTTFVENFADQFDDTDPETITFETVFRDLDDWSSLTALLIIAMVEEEYGVTLKGDDIIASKTIEDLYNIVLSRKNG